MANIQYECDFFHALRCKSRNLVFKDFTISFEILIALFCIFCYLAKVNHWAVDVDSPILFVPLNRVEISTSLLVHGTSERDTCSCTCLDFIPETTTCQGTRAGQENQYDGGLELQGWNLYRCNLCDKKLWWPPRVRVHVLVKRISMTLDWSFRAAISRWCGIIMVYIWF